jgi:hypothetical protein
MVKGKNMIKDVFRAKVNRCLDLLQNSLKEISALGERVKIEANEYYRLRHQVREAKAAFDEVKKEARRLFGPPPAYAPRDFERKREESLERLRLLVRSEEKEKIIEELFQDELIGRYFDPEEVKKFVEEQFESQKKGKRKLVNFKARLFIEKIKRDLNQAETSINSIKSKVDFG